MPRSGRSSLLLALFACALAGCWPYGFAGGGLPSNVRTVAVLPFENETAQAELQSEVWQALRGELRSRLGLRDAPEARADAVVRGTLLRYDTGIPIAYTGTSRQVSSARRKLQIVLDIEIVDQKSGKPLWQRKGLTAEGEYDEGPGEASGRRDALRKLVNDVVEGAQSQW